MVNEKSEVEDAIEKIITFAESNNLNIQPVRGKVIEYLKRVKPDHYHSLVQAGVVKDFQFNMDIKQQTKETYDKIASGFSASHFDHFWVDEFDFFKSIVNGNKVIDIGCGAGRDAAIFVKSGFDYTGIDISEGMLNVAKNRVPKGNFKQMDFSKINFPENSFDDFWASASFLHVPKNNIASDLLEAKRVTKNNGIGFISLKEKTEMDEGMINENKYGGISRYFTFYTQDEFKRLLENNNFFIIKMTKHTENDERKTNWLCYFIRIQK